MKYTKILLPALVCIILFQAGVSNVFAQDPEAPQKPPPQNITLNAPFLQGKETIDVSGDAISILGQYIEQIFVFGMALIVIFAVLMIMVAGFEYMFAGGDSGKTDNAKKRIMQALLGVVLVLLAALLLNIINPNFFTLASIV